jgi:capsular exopolysaccharide synthesis family protein
MKSTEYINIDLQKYWLSLKRHWPAAVAVFGPVTALSVGMAFLQKPEYEAQGKILLKINRTPSLTGVGAEFGELDRPLADKGNPLNTEVEIIHSIPLVEQTITALNLKNENGIPPKPQTLIKKQLDVKNIGTTNILQVSYKSSDPKEAEAVVNKLMNLYIERNVLNNKAEAVTAAKFIAQQLPTAEASVSQAEAALRQFKEKNQVVALDEEAKSAVEIIKELETQINQTQADLADTTTQSATLQKKVGMTSQEAIAINTLNQSPGVQKLLEEFQQLESQLAVQQNRFLDESPTIIDLKEKRATLKALLQQRIEQTLGENRTAVKALLQKHIEQRLGEHKQVSNEDLQNLQIGDSKQKLIDDFSKSEMERLSLVSRLEELHNARSAYKKRVSILPKLEKEQRELQRKLEAAQSTYQTLLKKLQEIRVAENQKVGNASILENALVPEDASIRKQIVTVVLGVLLGIFLTTAAVVILEVRDTSIKTLKETKELFGYTLLGTIPYFGKKVTQRRKEQEWTIPEVPVRDTPRSPLSEAYRMLQANLKFTSSDKAPKVIVVTSSIPKEGKSTISANLAAATAELGRRVLLVDADMRHPMQHHIWRLNNVAGLSNVLVDQVEFETTVAAGVMANLDILTAGVIPPNPMALLDSKRMASLIEYFGENYDLVIIDTPPLKNAADALTLGQMTDGVLFVAQPRVLNSSSAEASRELLERFGQKVLGLVVNGLILENEPDSYFHFTKEYSTWEDSTVHQQPMSNTRNYADRS